MPQEDLPEIHMKHRMSNNVVCPYYRCEERQMIYCEGVMPETGINLTFARPEMKKEYKLRYCEAKYGDCLIAQTLEYKWEMTAE